MKRTFIRSWTFPPRRIQCLKFKLFRVAAFIRLIKDKCTTMAFIHSHSRPVYDFACYRSESGICRKPITLFILISLMLLTSGCSSFYDAIRATPAPQTSFLPAQPKLKEMPPTFPFHKMWFNPSIDMNKYNKIMISKVNTGYVLDKIPWDRMNET